MTHKQMQAGIRHAMNLTVDAMRKAEAMNEIFLFAVRSLHEIHSADPLLAKIKSGHALNEIEKRLKVLTAIRKPANDRTEPIVKR